MEISWQPLNLKQAVPFRTSKAVRTDKTTLWVSIKKDGVTGWGEAVPMDTYRQNLQSAENTLRAIQNDPEFEIDPFQRDGTSRRLVDRFPDQLATVAAIDAAMYDWLGKKWGVPVATLLGFAVKDLPQTSYTIGIDEPAAMADRARAAASFPIFKIKVGVPNDCAMLEAIREVAPEKRIRVDANGGWSVDEAISRLRELERFNLEFVEQPLPADSPIDDWKRLRGEVGIPIMADESCILPNDVPRLAGLVDAVNIKLGKCGGITPAKGMIAVARALGFKIMLGSMIESALGIAPAAHLASQVDFLDLDGHLLLSDPKFDGIGGDSGQISLSGSPGLGLTPRI